ncbi:hypothetical protein ACR6C2_05295 [Streptomyces sp. INA 01156]
MVHRTTRSRRLLPLVEAGSGRAVVYRSTPAEAIRTFRQLSQDLPGLEVTLVHEQMRNKDRWRCLAACRDTFSPDGGVSGPSVLVTTPMLEHVRGLRFDLVVSGRHRSRVCWPVRHRARATSRGSWYSKRTTSPNWTTSPWCGVRT